jgi:hypothetical protein
MPNSYYVRSTIENAPIQDQEYFPYINAVKSDEYGYGDYSLNKLLSLYGDDT